MTVHWRAEVRKRIGSPVHFRTYNPLVNGAEISGLFSAAGCARRVMSASDDYLLESEVRRNELAPRSEFEVTTRTLATSRGAPKRVRFATDFLPESGVAG